jgi:hypothetical protein
VVGAVGMGSEGADIGLGLMSCRKEGRKGPSRGAGKGEKEMTVQAKELNQTKNMSIHAVGERGDAPEESTSRRKECIVLPHPW